MIVYNAVPIQGVYRNGSACPVYYNQHRVWPDAAPPQRYEACLFSSTDGNGASAGTLKSAVSAFDSILLRTKFNTTYAGGNCYEMVYTGGGQTFPVYTYTNSNFYVIHNKFSANDSTLSWVLAPESAFSSMNYMFPGNTTAAATIWTGNANSRKVIKEIWGVKYQ